MENTQIHEEDQDIIEAGYKPQLQRTLGFFSSFAISFSFMSILMGIFAGYGYVLNKSGPFGLWIWPIVGLGQLLVSLIFAEMASRIPLTGSLYNWNTKLSSPATSWLVGWFVIFAYTIAAPGIIAAMIPPLQTLWGGEFTKNIIFLIAFAIIALHFLISVYGVRLAAYLNKLAVIAELIALVVFGVLLALVLFAKGDAHPELFTTIPATPIPYWPAFLAAILLPAFTIFGFESPSDLSEETLSAKRIVPRSIISSVIVSVVLGFLFLVVLTLSISNLGAISSATDPISTIMSSQLGVIATEIFLICVVIAMFAVSLLNMMLSSRIIFAMARDTNFIAPTFFKKISSRQVPANAIAIIALIELITFYFFSGLIALYAAPVILLFTAYLITVINFARKSKTISSAPTFSLGAWHWPAVILATLWLIAAIAILTIPEEFHLSAQIAGGVTIFGLLLYGVVKKFVSSTSG